MEFGIINTCFDNDDTINFFNYLLKKNLPIDKITLNSCTNMKNRINIIVTLNNYKTFICPVKTTYHWFSVTRQHISDSNQLTDDDVYKFSSREKDYDKLFNFIWGDNNINNISETIEQIKRSLKDIKTKIKFDKALQ